MVSREEAERFFVEVVLKSTKIPDKPTYNMREAAEILGYSTTIGFYKARSGGCLELDVVKLSETKGGGRRVYRESLIRLFQRSLVKEAIRIHGTDGGKKRTDVGRNESTQEV